MREISVSLPTVNEQSAEHAVVDTFGCIDVHSIFPTIQGEGPHAGRPAVFVRLAGCNLTCPACDTDYTSTRDRMSVHHVINRIATVNPVVDTPTLVVITGGEPFRQDITELINRLLEFSHEVQIETNGTLWRKSMSNIRPNHSLQIVCSPKTPLLNERICPYITSLKYIVDAENVSERDGLPMVTVGNVCGVARPWPGFMGKVYVQPLDVQDEGRNKANVEAAIRSCMKFGYVLSYQIHKAVGLP